jgi:hypothetical protein
VVEGRAMTPVTWLIVLLALGVLGLAVVVAGIRARNMHYWLRSYIGRRKPWPQQKTIVYVAVADHYEPYEGTQDRVAAYRRLDRWVQTYPAIAAAHRDSVGRHPCHTFFYPIEEYDPGVLDALADLTRRGFGDVDVHFHHDNDNAASLRASLLGFTKTLRERHGLLQREGATPGEIPYTFVHGNWALDNSRPDGRWCGVDNELQVLVETGCKADFTMPSAPSDTQTAKINSIYFARGRDGCRKSHDTGRDVAVGAWGAPDELLLVQGPLGLNWRRRKLGVIPKIENAEISADAPPTAERVPLWFDLAPRVKGAESHVFIKLHTHGAQDPTLEALLGGGLSAMWTELERRYANTPGYELRYVSCWEMYRVIRALALGEAK